MRNRYLRILQLNADASKADIKKAYRKLSKIHHPDLSKDPRAKENFIRINEAYDFLMKVGPQYKSRNHKKKPTYNFNSEEERFKEFRRKARARAKYKARQSALAQMQIVIKLNGYFQYISLAIVIFNLALSLDYLLPGNYSDENVEWLSPVIVRDKNNLNYKEMNKILFEKHQMIIDESRVSMQMIKGKAEIESTAIFGYVIKAKFNTDSGHFILHPYRNPYLLDLLLLPVIAVLLISHFKIARHPEYKLYMAVSATFLFLMQIGNLLL